MNLYDKDDGFKRFSLDEANGILPKVIRVTEKTVKLLEDVRKQHGLDEAEEVEDAQGAFQEEAAAVLESWSRQIVGLGGYPKGYFTVDFKSPIPDTLFCWTLGEHQITHTHKTYESFKNRIPITDELSIGFEQTLN